MKIAILSSSRADYGIYQPLLKAFDQNPDIHFEIVAFGTHLSERHGMTINMIEADGYRIVGRIPFLADDDSPQGISKAIGENIAAFSKFWNTSDHELIFALGDRYEMFAAVTAALPFGKKIAHLHGGETTLGAIDNAFRHSITHMSHIHFTCTEQYRSRVVELIGSDQNVYNVGALSFDHLTQIELLETEEFLDQFGIDLSDPTILITFHPETVGSENNTHLANELCATLSELSDFQQVITMPNADTSGQLIRSVLNEYIAAHPNTIAIENFGSLGYLSCMKHCSFMLGNTSSGMTEAAFFPTPVINVGARQQGRIRTPNVVDVEMRKNDILDAVGKIEELRVKDVQNIYGTGNAATNILNILTGIHG